VACPTGREPRHAQTCQTRCGRSSSNRARCAHARAVRRQIGRRPRHVDHRDTDPLEPKRLHGLANVDCHPVRLPAVTEPAARRASPSSGGCVGSSDQHDASRVSTASSRKRGSRSSSRSCDSRGNANVDPPGARVQVIPASRCTLPPAALRHPCDHSVWLAATASESTSSGWDGSSMERS